ARVANRLVGNPDHAAVIECSMTGPRLHFETETTIAWVGWGNERSGRPMPVKDGTRLDLSGKLHSLRGYIAVAGGIEVPKVFSSASTDVRARLGGQSGRALREGDHLSIGQLETTPISSNWHVSWPRPGGYRIELRVLRGIQARWFSEEARRKFTNTFYEVSPSSDRTGCRLVGPPLTRVHDREMVSQPVVSGSIQVPPDGQPIVLMGERQTIGGYPQIAHVISADLPLLARAWPGTQIHFHEVSLDEAREAWRNMQRDLGFLQAGLQSII
ncbi:MAG: biotin-dependent carboxyltransferase family protein, partial [Akkermansiaceae bacterium]|nr:biotin-dependent carboxyltransferase family protein [Akkermansiaceae bacterium]